MGDNEFFLFAIRLVREYNAYNTITNSMLFRLLTTLKLYLPYIVPAQSYYILINNDNEVDENNHQSLIKLAT